MNLANKKLFLMPVFIILLCSFASASTVTEKFEKTYRFNPGGELTLENTNGSVTVRSWDRDEVRIEAIKKVKARSSRDAKDYMKRVRIRVDYNPDEINIEADYPRRSGGGGGLLSWLFGGRRTPSVTITYTITVPKKADLDIDTTNGSVSISEVNGRIIAESTNGKLKIEEVRGSIDAHTTNGGIHAEVTDFSDNDDVYLKTVNGHITLYLPRDVEADVSASTVNGGIDTRFPLTVTGRWGPKKLNGTLNGGGGEIELRTVNGGIDIKRW